MAMVLLLAGKERTDQNQNQSKREGKKASHKNTRYNLFMDIIKTVKDLFMADAILRRGT